MTYKSISRACSCINCKFVLSAEKLSLHFLSKACKNGSAKNPSKKFPIGLLTCPFCEKECKNHNSLCQHAVRCKLNPNRVVHSHSKGGNIYGKPSWSKGLTKDTDARIAKSCKTRAENIASGKTVIPPGKPLSTEHRQKLSKLAIERGFGGVRQSKKILHNGVKLGSTYELILAKSLDLNKVKWELPKRFFYIDPNGKTRTYTPDFYLPEYNLYLDPKNDFLIKNVNPHLGFSDLQKIDLVQLQNNITVLVLNKNQLSWESIMELLDRLARSSPGYKSGPSLSRG